MAEFSEVMRQAQRMWLEEKLSQLLEYATGGRHSEINCSSEQMRQWVDDWRQDVCNGCKQLKAAARERDAAVADLTNLMRYDANGCHVCKWNDAEKIVCKAPIPYCEKVAEWRGVQEEE